MVKKYGDIISGGLFLLFAAVLFRLSLDIKVSSISKFGGTIVPQGVALIIAALSVVVILGGIRKLRAAGDEGEKQPKDAAAARTGLFPLAAVLAVSVAYVLLLDKVGFIVMTSLCLGAQMFILSGFRVAKLPVYASVSVAFTIGINYIFVNIFYLMLPAGILG